MLSVEEKKAIEILKNEKSNLYILQQTKFTTCTVEQAKAKRKAIDTVLILLTKLQKENEEKEKEIENLKNEINKAWEEWNDLEQGSYEEEIRLKEEIKKKDKQIDLMGLAILNYDDQLVINRYKNINEVKDLAKEKRE